MTKEQQRTSALAEANRRRIGKARIKQELAAMTTPAALRQVAGLLVGDHDHDHEIVGSFTLQELLVAIPRFGRQRARALIRHAGMISPDRRVRDLTNRQLVVIASLLCHPDTVWPGSRIRVEEAA